MIYTCLCLPSRIYRPRKDGRLSRPWCEVAQAEIRTRNLPIANVSGSGLDILDGKTSCYFLTSVDSRYFRFISGYVQGI